MTNKEILSLKETFSKEGSVELIETHISWVILTEEFAYKFKKPIRNSFLNYSKPIRREFYCEQELELNSRYSDIYLDVVAVYKKGDSVQLNKGDEVIDFGVKMLKMNPDFRMDIMLRKDQVSPKDMINLANKIAAFHQNAEVVSPCFSPREMSQQFNDIYMIKSFLYKEIGLEAEEQINEAILESNYFVNGNVSLFQNRVEFGFIRDLHGDLHAKNIFLYKDPVIFDCIEFNDNFRQIDVLSEIAFMCMDLEANGKEDLSNDFLTTYLESFPAMSNLGEEQLFVYYKSYRANVRAKVNALQAKQAAPREKKQFLKEVTKYLNMMTKYKDQFSKSTSQKTKDVISNQSHFLYVPAY